MKNLERIIITALGLGLIENAAYARSKNDFSFSITPLSCGSEICGFGMQDIYGHPMQAACQSYDINGDLVFQKIYFERGVMQGGLSSASFFLPKRLLMNKTHIYGNNFRFPDSNGAELWIRNGIPEYIPSYSMDSQKGIENNVSNLRYSTAESMAKVEPAPEVKLYYYQITPFLDDNGIISLNITNSKGNGINNTVEIFDANNQLIQSGQERFSEGTTSVTFGGEYFANLPNGTYRVHSWGHDNPNSLKGDIEFIITLPQSVSTPIEHIAPPNTPFVPSED